MRRGRLLSVGVVVDDGLGVWASMPLTQLTARGSTRMAWVTSPRGRSLSVIKGK